MLLAMKYGCHIDTLIHCLKHDLFYLKGPIYTFYFICIKLFRYAGDLIEYNKEGYLH